MQSRNGIVSLKIFLVIEIQITVMLHKLMNEEDLSRRKSIKDRIDFGLYRKKIF